MGGPGSLRGCRYVYSSIHIERDWRQTYFPAARLIANPQRNVLRAAGRISHGGHWDTQNDAVLLNVERLFRESKCVQLALGIGNCASLETAERLDAQFRGNQVVLRSFAGVDVKAIADFQHDRKLEASAARYGID